MSEIAAEVARSPSAGHPDVVPLLASVPLNIALRVCGDAGVPMVLADPEDPASIAIRAIAEALAARRSRIPGD